MDGKEYLKFNQENAKKYPIYLKEGYANYYNINSSLVDNFLIISKKDYHCFSGYYDIDNVSPNGKYLLYLLVKKHSSPCKDKALINVYNLINNETTQLVETNAWCWQQGCRMRWIDNERIMFNDYINGHYVSKIFSIITKKECISFDSVFYDISLKSNIGLSLNFDRLQINRPGYGYSNITNKVEELCNLSEDGIWITNLRTKSKKLLIKLKDLKDEVLSNPFDNHYINHIVLSPLGDKFMFFHLWARDSLDMWKMRMIVANVDGSNRVVVEEQNIISHYCWINNDELLVTKQVNDEYRYFIYDVNNCSYVKIDDKNLCFDGHPTVLNENSIFVSDTYPLEHSLQELFIYNIREHKKENIFKGFSDPRLYIEERCDLHPKLSKGKNLINIDSTFKDGVRSIFVLKIKEDKYDF